MASYFVQLSFKNIRMKKLKISLFKGNKHNKIKSLSELDGLYKEIVISFPKDERVKYCKRLIAQLSYELQNDSCLDKKRKAELNQLLIAAKVEIQNIGVD